MRNTLLGYFLSWHPRDSSGKTTELNVPTVLDLSKTE